MSYLRLLRGSVSMGRSLRHRTRMIRRIARVSLIRRWCRLIRSHDLRRHMMTVTVNPCILWIRRWTLLIRGISMRLILCVNILRGLIRRIIGLILRYAHLSLRRRSVTHRTLLHGPLIRLIRLHVTVRRSLLYGCRLLIEYMRRLRGI